jgi:hypothetical protein
VAQGVNWPAASSSGSSACSVWAGGGAQHGRAAALQAVEAVPGRGLLASLLHAQARVRLMDGAGVIQRQRRLHHLATRAHRCAPRVPVAPADVLRARVLRADRVPGGAGLREALGEVSRPAEALAVASRHAVRRDAPVIVIPCFRDGSTSACRCRAAIDREVPGLSGSASADLQTASAPNHKG